MNKPAQGRAPADREARRNFVILLVITTSVMLAIVLGTIVLLAD